MRLCQRCRKEFKPNRSWQRYCSDECRVEDIADPLCPHCGKTREGKELGVA